MWSSDASQKALALLAGIPSLECLSFLMVPRWVCCEGGSRERCAGLGCRWPRRGRARLSLETLPCPRRRQPFLRRRLPLSSTLSALPNLRTLKLNCVLPAGLTPAALEAACSALPQLTRLVVHDW